MIEKKAISIYIIEHHQSVLAGYKLWLGKETDMKLMGTADHPRQALNKITSSPKKPDVLILDYAFGNETIIPYIEELQNVCPNAKSMAVTGYDLPHVVRSLKAQGLDGIITKDDGADGFIQCIRAIIGGGVYHSKKISNYLQHDDELSRVMRTLTPAENRVLRELAKGLPDSTILENLGIASSTLDNHRTKILSKLRNHGYEVHSKAELVQWYNGNIGSPTSGQTTF